MTKCVANPFTGSCGCPAGSSRSNAYNTHTGTDPSSCRRAAGLCTDTDALPLTFGGAFHDLDDGIGPDCDDTSSKFAICLTNPMTGDCSCPPGFEESRHPITRQDPLAPSRGDILGSCPATFTVCWRNAP